MADEMEDIRLSRVPWQNGTGAVVPKGFYGRHKQFPTGGYTCFIWAGRANDWYDTTRRGQPNRKGFMVDLEFNRPKPGGMGSEWVYHVEKYFERDFDAVDYAERLRTFIDSKTIRELMATKKSGKIGMSKFESRSTWRVLEGLLREARKYRGDSGIRKVDLEKLLDAIKKAGGLSDAVTIDTKGGSFSCKYGFDPKIWGKWFTSSDAAFAVASTDKDVVGQYAGRSQGHTVHKKNWGGRVVNVPGKARTDFERLPSAMDRYDVMMIGDITPHTKVNKRTGENELVETGMLVRVAYSPSIGSQEQRQARLEQLIAGDTGGDLPRRPQPDIPDRCPKQGCTLTAGHRGDHKFGPEPPEASRVPRVGQNLKIRGDDDEVPQTATGGGGAPSSFKTKLAKHNAEYEPRRRSKNDDDAVDAAMDALFPKKGK